jgi:hypothetical protein
MRAPKSEISEFHKHSSFRGNVNAQVKGNSLLVAPLKANKKHSVNKIFVYTNPRQKPKDILAGL